MPIARYYDAEKNEEGRYFPGVPQGDIDEARWEALPKWLQETVDASPMYRKTKVAATAKAKPAAPPAAPRARRVVAKPPAPAQAPEQAKEQD
jgi:hypothetical protein